MLATNPFLHGPTSMMISNKNSISLEDILHGYNLLRASLISTHGLNLFISKLCVLFGVDANTELSG